MLRRRHKCQTGQIYCPVTFFQSSFMRIEHSIIAKLKQIIDPIFFYSTGSTHNYVGTLCRCQGPRKCDYTNTKRVDKLSKKTFRLLLIYCSHIFGRMLHLACAHSRFSCHEDGVSVGHVFLSSTKLCDKHTHINTNTHIDTHSHTEVMHD